MELYCEIAVLGVQQQATIRPGHAHDTTWQGHDIGHDTDGRPAGGACSSARARMAWPGGRVTILCIVAGGGFCIAIWMRYRLWHDHGAPRYGAWCKTRENSNFLKNDKTVISIKIRNFFRSRMMKQISLLESSREI